MAERLASPPPIVSPTPFVGREEELDLLRVVFDRVAARTPHLVTITGEAGVGKGRLVSEFVSRLGGDGVRLAVLQGRCLPFGVGVSFWALREMVMAHAGIQPGDEPDAASGKIAASVRAAVAERAERGWVIARLSALVGIDQGHIPLPQDVEQGEWFAAWRRFLEGVALAAGSLVLVFRDMQWADPALLAFIQQLVDSPAGASILVVCLARPDIYDRAPEWGGGKRLSMALSLTPLSEPETAELVEGLLQAGGRRGSLDPATQRELIERSAGIPLFAEQFVDLVDGRASGQVTFVPSEPDAGTDRARDGRAGGHTGAEGSIPVPGSLQSLIASRLADLPREHRRLLLDAAVVGRHFWVGAVAALGGLEEDAVRVALRQLARRDLVRSVRNGQVDPGQPDGEQEFVFANGLIRDVAYTSVPPDELASKHATTADWIEQAAPWLGDRTELLVHHFERAVELAPALPPGRREEFDVERMAVRAMEYLEAAGDRAIRFDAARAQHSYRQALELCPPDHPHRPSVLARVARTAWLVGDFEEARGRYEEAVAVSLAGGDTAAAGEGMLDLSYALWNQGATVQAREVLAEAITLLEGEEPGPVLAQGYATMAADRFMAGDSEGALRWCEKVLVLAQELDLPERKERALEVRGMARCDLGDQAGLEDLRAALGLALDLGLGQETVRAYLNLGTFVLPVEGPAAALDLYRTGQALAERRGLVAMSMWLRGWAVGPLFELGRWDELMREADAVAAWERDRGGLTQFGLAARLTEAEARVLRGQVERAAALVGDFLPRAREIGDPQALIPALAVSALVAQAQGEADRAVEMIEELARKRRAGGRWAGALFLALSVRILEWAGQARLAERLLEEADPSSARGRHSAASARAAVAEASGRPEEAAGLYATAAAGWDAFGFVLERALALAGEARCLGAVGRAAEAADRLATAQRLLAGLGMRGAPDLEGTDRPESMAEPAGGAGA